MHMNRHQVPDLWRGKNLFMLHPLQRYKILKLIRIFHFCLEISGSETNALCTISSATYQDGFLKITCVAQKNYLPARENFSEFHPPLYRNAQKKCRKPGFFGPGFVFLPKIAFFHPRSAILHGSRAHSRDDRRLIEVALRAD